MKVVIKPEHLIGNGYSNSGGEKKRNCPLWEALKAAGHIVKRVGMEDLDIDDNEHYRYFIPKEWNKRTVDEYIEAAENGDTKEIELELTPAN